MMSAEYRRIMGFLFGDLWLHQLLQIFYCAGRKFVRADADTFPSVLYLKGRLTNAL